MSRTEGKEKRKRKKEQSLARLFEERETAEKSRDASKREGDSNVLLQCEKGKDVQRGRDGEVSVEEAKNKSGNRNRNETGSPNSEQERDG